MTDWVSLMTPENVVDLLINFFLYGVFIAASVLIVVEGRRWRRFMDM